MSLLSKLPYLTRNNTHNKEVPQVWSNYCGAWTHHSCGSTTAESWNEAVTKQCLSIVNISCVYTRDG